MQSPATGAARRQLTVMFCDLVDSVPLSERLDPEELRDLMQSYQRACGEVIARYEGHVAQYRGDGVLVYFSWPVAHEDDVVRAIRAGLEITASVSRLAESVPIAVRVGIHTGLVVIGESGFGEASVPNAVAGDTPNIAARLQALAEPGSVVVSEVSATLARGLFDFIDLGPHTLKGIRERVRLFRVSGARVIESHFEATRSEVMLTPLVGRDEEVALLLRRWRQAEEGEGQVVLIGGDPGIGKSRLTRVLRERLRHERALVLRYQCSPYHVNSALHPMIDQLERAAGFAREDSLEQRLDKLEAMLVGSKQEIAESAALLAALLSLPTARYPEENWTPERRKQQTLEALNAQIEGLAAQRPLLMIFEDIHWIDATSQEALDLLVPRLQDLPVLLVATHRPEYSPRWSDQAHVTALGVNRLSRRQGAELLVQLTDGKALPSEVIEQILYRTDGVPLFLEELTKSVLESKLVRLDNDRYVLDAPLPAPAIPTTLRDSLLARLDQLAPVREIAQIGACIGREFSYVLLTAVAPVAGQKLDEALEQLTGSGLMFRRGTPPAATYIFKHALVQGAAYDSLLKSKRIQIHARIADNLEKQFPEVVVTQPELIAHHHTNADNIDVAIRYWRRAGDRAIGRGAVSDAMAHFDRGMELLARITPSPARSQLELGLHTSMAWLAMTFKGWAAPDAKRHASAAWELAQSTGQMEDAERILWVSHVYELTRGRVRESLNWVDELGRLAAATGNPAIDLIRHSAAVGTHLFLGEFRAVEEHADFVDQIFDALKHQPQIRRSTWNDISMFCSHVPAFRARAQLLLGFPDQAVRTLKQALALAHQRGHPATVCFVLVHVAAVQGVQADLSPFEATIHELEQISKKHRLTFQLEVILPRLRADLARFRGSADEADKRLASAIETWKRVGSGLLLPYFYSIRADIVADLGKLDSALALVSDALTQIAQPGWDERFALAEVLRVQARALTLKGDPIGAEQTFKRSLDLAREQQAKWWELRSATSYARFLQSENRTMEAVAVLQPVYDWFTEGFGTRDMQEAKALLEGLR